MQWAGHSLVECIIEVWEWDETGDLLLQPFIPKTAHNNDCSLCSHSFAHKHFLCAYFIFSDDFNSKTLFSFLQVHWVIMPCFLALYTCQYEGGLSASYTTLVPTAGSICSPGAVQWGKREWKEAWEPTEGKKKSWERCGSGLVGKKEGQCFLTATEMSCHTWNVICSVKKQLLWFFIMSSVAL